MVNNNNYTFYSIILSFFITLFSVIRIISFIYIISFILSMKPVALIFDDYLVSVARDAQNSFGVGFHYFEHLIKSVYSDICTNESLTEKNKTLISDIVELNSSNKDLQKEIFALQKSLASSEASLDTIKSNFQAPSVATTIVVTTLVAVVAVLGYTVFTTQTSTAGFNLDDREKIRILTSLVSSIFSKVNTVISGDSPDTSAVMDDFNSLARTQD
jgi:hypothetical protein